MPEPVPVGVAFHSEAIFQLSMSMAVMMPCAPGGVFFMVPQGTKTGLFPFTFVDVSADRCLRANGPSGMSSERETLPFESFTSKKVCFALSTCPLGLVQATQYNMSSLRTPVERMPQWSLIW